MDNIARINGRDAFAYSGDKPWHQKGTEVPGLMTIGEGMRAAALDWEVLKIPVMLDDLSMARVPGHYATVRMGPDTDVNGELVRHPLGMVGSKYQPIQNTEVFSFFDSALGEGVACLETVGALGNGERVFALARLPEVAEITPGDPITRYICLTAHHAGKGCVEGLPTDTRVVCQNTLNIALGTRKAIHGRVKIKHTSSFKVRMEQAHEVLCENRQYWEKASEAFRALAMRDMTRLDVIAFLDKMFPAKKVTDPDTGKVTEKLSGKTRNNREAVERLFDGEARGSDLVGRSAWGMFQAFTEWNDHHRSVQKDTDRWEATQFGTGVGLRQKAFDALVSLV